MYVGILDDVTKISKTIFLHYFFLFAPKTDFNWPVFELADSLFRLFQSDVESLQSIFHFSYCAFLFVSILGFCCCWFCLFLAALGLHSCTQAFSSCLERVGSTLCCGVWASHCSVSSRWGAQVLGMWASAVAVLGPSVCSTEAYCPLPCGIFPNQGSNVCLCIGRWILNHWITSEVPIIGLFNSRISVWFWLCLINSTIYWYFLYGETSILLISFISLDINSFNSLNIFKISNLSLCLTSPTFRLLQGQY